MEPFHFLNFLSQKELCDYFEQIESLSKSWINPLIRIDKIIFSKLSVARNFLENLAGTPWFNQTHQIQNENCLNKCLLKDMKKFYEFPIHKISPPSIICSLDNAYELNRILQIFTDSKNIKIEILCSDRLEMKEDLKYFLQDKFPELESIILPRFSLVHSNYEIEINNIKQKKRKSRSRKPPASFQKLLKKYAPKYYPEIIGSDYYGQQVFNSILNLYLNQISNNDNFNINQILPSSPMKMFDLQDFEGAFEFRFQDYIPLEMFNLWLEKLKDILEDSDGGLEMARFSYVFDAWSDDIDFKNASLDRFIFGWNDLEFAFSQRNLEVIQKAIKEDVKSASIYFQLTPKILDDDFRITLMKTNFNQPIVLK